MRRAVLALALVAGPATLVPTARAADVYAGESQVAHAGFRVRGTDGVLYQVEVQVAKHALADVRVDHVLRFRLATCGEHGCSGPWYSADVAPGQVSFTPEGVTLRATFARTVFDVTWKARRPKRELDPTKPAPDAGMESGAVVVTAHRDTRSSPAVIRFAGLSCPTAASSIVNQTGVVVTQGDQDEQRHPDRLPKGFYPTARRKPRCF